METILCYVCGSRIVKGETFCPNCYTPLTNSDGEVTKTFKIRKSLCFRVIGRICLIAGLVLLLTRLLPGWDFGLLLAGIILVISERFDAHWRYT